jgi:hypothetical protein
MIFTELWRLCAMYGPAVFLPRQRWILTRAASRGKPTLWVIFDRTGKDHSAMNFRIALKADVASVNFAH